MIVGVDPGPVESALVVLDDEGKIQYHYKLPNSEIIKEVGYLAIGNHYLCIEMIASYGMAVGREVFETCVWIGRFLQKWDEYSYCVPQRLTRNAIKIHTCGTVKAKDTNIRQAMIDRFGEPGSKNNPGQTYGITKDQWAALSVAATAYDMRKDLFGI